MAPRKPSNKFEPADGKDHPGDHAQVLSHLRLLGLQVGLMINFHVVVLKDGVRRIVNQCGENLESQSARRKSAEDAEKI